MYFEEEVNWLSGITNDMCLDILKEYLKMLFTANEVYKQNEIPDLKYSMFDLAYLGRILFQMLYSLSTSNFLPNQDDVHMSTKNMPPEEQFVHDTINELNAIQNTFYYIRKLFQRYSGNLRIDEFYRKFREKYHLAYCLIEEQKHRTTNFSIYKNPLDFIKRFMPVQNKPDTNQN